MHLDQCTLLISLIGEAHKAIATRDAGDGVEHDFSTLAAEERADELWLPVVAQTQHWIAEDSDEVRVGGLWGKIADKNTVLSLILRRRRGRAQGGSHGRREGRGPVQTEGLGRVGHGALDLGENRGSVGRTGEGEEAVARVVCLLASGGLWDLDGDGVPAHERTDLLGIFFVHPRLQVGPEQRRAGMRDSGRARRAGVV